MQTRWYKIAQEGELPIDQVLTATAGVKTVCLIHTEEHGYTALDNRCPHQGGPLGEGQLDGRWLICPWHGYEYDPLTGDPPDGYGDCAKLLPVEVRADGICVQVEEEDHQPTVSDHMVGVMTAYPLPSVLADVILPEGTVWQTEGFTGAVMRYDSFVAATDPAQMLLDPWRAVLEQGQTLML